MSVVVAVVAVIAEGSLCYDAFMMHKIPLVFLELPAERQPRMNDM